MVEHYPGRAENAGKKQKVSQGQTAAVFYAGWLDHNPLRREPNLDGQKENAEIRDEQHEVKQERSSVS